MNRDEAIFTKECITLAEFFTDNDMIELTPDLKQFYEDWLYLPPDKKEFIVQAIKFMR